MTAPADRFADRFAADLDAVLADIRALLVAKNAAYGDSALNPIRLFAGDLDAEAQLRVRIDDKLSRLARGQRAGEDVEVDLLGYLILLRIARRRGGGGGGGVPAQQRTTEPAVTPPPHPAPSSTSAPGLAGLTAPQIRRDREVEL